jgi:glycosyltransferase involved in cell wall biosynthesis
VPVILEADGAMSYEWLRYNNPDGLLWKSWVLYLEHMNLRCSTHIIAQSQVTRNYYRRLYKVPSSSISVITNGTDIPVPKHRERRRRELSIPSDAIVCGFLGSLHYWHGIDSFLSLFRNLLPRFPQVYFLFLGSGGPLTQTIQNSIENDLSSRILFVPYIEHEQIADYIDLFDIALAPYPKTAVFYYSPVKIFEYMALGKAILTVPLGQIRRVVSDGQSALFYRYDDPSDLETKLVTLIEHPEQRTALGHEAARLIREYHTWAHKAKALEMICRTVTEKRMGEREDSNRPVYN